MDIEQIQRAVRVCGGPMKVATLLECSHQTVRNYQSGERRMPVELVVRLERETRRLGQPVTRQQMCPKHWQDIWPELILVNALAATPADAAPQGA